MPISFIIAGLAATAGITGITKGVKSITKNSEAKRIISNANFRYNSVLKDMNMQKYKTSKQLESLGELKLVSWSEDIGTFISLFSDFKKVKLESEVNLDEILINNVNNVEELKQMQIASLKASEVLKFGVGSLGAGALTGIASYGGAMMFASASTGTAIATLSGVASTNATMAWFGGGALASGGMGMAGGAVVLGGIVLGPVLAVAGFIMAAKSEENLSRAKKLYSEARNAVEKMKIMTTFLEGIEEIAYSYEIFISSFRLEYQELLHGLIEVKERAFINQEKYILNRIKKIFKIKIKIDFNQISLEDQQVLHISWLMTQILNAVLSAPLLTQKGEMDKSAQLVLVEAEKTIINLLDEGV